MIHIENGDFEFDGNVFELVSDLGMFWFMLETNPKWWDDVRHVILPSLIETENMTDDQVDFLTELRELCEKHPHLFDKNVKSKNVKIGKLKYEGGKK